MKRRNFIQMSAIAAISLQTTVSITGCGSSSSSEDTNSAGSTSSNVDERLLSVSTKEAAVETLHKDVAKETDDLLKSNSDGSFEIFQKFQDNTLTLTPSNTDLYFPQNKVWDNYIASHELAYKQASAQLTKLKASLRAYEYENITTQTSLSAITPKTALQTSVSSTTQSAIDTFLKAVEDFKSLQFGAVAVDGLALSIKLVLVVIEQIQNTATGSYYIQLIFNAVADALKFIANQSLKNLSFSSDTNIILSISKLGVAVMSLLAAESLSSFQAPTSQTQVGLQTTQENDRQALIQNIALQSQLIITITTLINEIMNTVLSTTQTLASNVTDPNYVLTDGDNELISSLKPLSQGLSALGLVMKLLLTLYQNSINALDPNADPLQGDATTYSILFGNPINSYDTTFSAFSSANFDTIFANNPIISQLLNDLGLSNPNFNVSTSAEAQGITIPIESDAYGFATLLASLSYQFTSDTTTQAADFATHLANLAYQFTMKIEDDAYTFAMQGMEYGYLFASRGEEVGLMADRILWMAVQIGQMADRIGEMADRIVYTEQLIVYTEMLILDFGLLIYGGMKQISNLILMGMAIIFDRQWYATLSTEDPIITTIADMTEHMLENMQEYELAVLQNQISLRNTTLKALNWIQGQY